LDPPINADKRRNLEAQAMGTNLFIALIALQQSTAFIGVHRRIQSFLPARAAAVESRKDLRKPA